MLNKTKAALQGRLSHFSNSAENNITLVDQVNARRFAHIFSGYGKSTALTSPTLARPDFSRASAIRWFYSASSASLQSTAGGQLSAVFSSSPNLKGGVSIFGHTPKSGESVRLSLSESVLSFYPNGGNDRLPQNDVISAIRDLQIQIQAFPQIRGYTQSPEKSGGHINIGKSPVQCLVKKRYIQNETTIITITTVCHSFSISLIPSTGHCQISESLRLPLARYASTSAENTFVIVLGVKPIFFRSRFFLRRLRKSCSEMAFVARSGIFVKPSAGGSSSSKGQRFMVHSCDSVPRCANSLRIILLIHAETVASPSWAIAFLISLSSSSSTRKAICLLPLPLIEMVDTWFTPSYDWACQDCMTSVNQKATPRTVGAVSRRLTKPLSEVTVMAGNQHTQTHPKFTWRFLAIDRADMAAKPCLISAIAENEKDARRVLAPYFILSLAARLPVVVVSHA